MKNAKKILVPLLAVMFLTSITLGLAWAETPSLPGITVKDTHPNGCIDCHKIEGSNNYTLPAELKKFPNHPDITNVVKNVPTDCLMCHRAGTTAGPLSQRLHKVHYQNPTTNHFISSFGGDCLNCHTLDLKTGVMGVKSGPANW